MPRSSTSRGMRTQTPVSPTPAQAPEEEAEKDPFAVEPAKPLPAGMTGSDANDPRFKLTPGLYDAAETSMGMKHLQLLKKPGAFQLGVDQPDDPKVQKMLGQFGMRNTAKMPKPMQLVVAQLAFANSDLAFQGNYLFQGNFYGVSIYDISNPANAVLLTSLVCPGGQGDVSVHGNLLFMSVEMPNGRLDCGTEGFPPEPPPAEGHEKKRRLPAAQKDRFRGVRIFDISDIRNPKQLAAVPTGRGAHTHTLVMDPNDKDNVYIYVSGTSFVRQPEELAGCSNEQPEKDPNTALFRIDVIKVPVAAPQEAKVVSSPRVFIDPRTGAMNGLNNGGSSHGKAEEKPADTNQCHDITVYSAVGLAAGACSGNAKVLFTDEWGGGLGARCRPNDPNKWGADAIFHLKDNKLSLAGYYKLPAAQGDTENCVAHNGSLIPVPGRDIEVQAWYQGGISVMDFTDAAHPFEIAYFDRGPVDPNSLVLGGDWSAYWYNGRIYASEIARGLDVFELMPTQFLTQNEIDAAKTVRVAELNVQNQQKIEWPAQFVVAKAYLDQLMRSLALPAERIAALQKAMQSAESSHMNKKELAKLKGMADSLEQSAATAMSPGDSARLHALAEILKHPAA